MTHKVKFLLNNLIQDSVLSCADLYPTLGIENTKYSSKSQVARSTVNNTIIITGTLNVVSVSSGFVIGNHNFKTGTKYRLQVYSQGLGNLEYDTQVNGVDLEVSAEESADSPDTIQYNLAIWYPEVAGTSGFKLTIIDDSAINDYFQIGRLFMGKVIGTEIGASYGHNIYWRENTKQYRTEAGTLRSDIVSPSKTIDFSLNTVYENERSEIQRAFSTVGKQKDFFISLFPLDCSDIQIADYSGIVKMTKTPKYTEFAPSFYAAKYTVEEI